MALSVLTAGIKVAAVAKPAMKIMKEWTHDGLKPGDISLLRELEKLVPEGPSHLVGTRLLAPDDQPHLPWLPSLNSTQLSSMSTRREVREVAVYVLCEIKEYFDAKHPGIQIQNARTVFAGQLVHWATQAREKDTTMDSLRWWCDYLLHVEDAKPFTKSNLATASHFQKTLTNCRVALVELRNKLEDTSVNLKDDLEAPCRTMREAADELLLLLYTALRPKPAANCRCFLDLKKAADACSSSPDAFRAHEDRLVFLILQLERTYGSADVLASAFIKSIGSDVEVPSEVEGDVREATGLAQQLSELKSASHEQSQTCTRLDPSLIDDLGHQTLMAYIELLGQYCILSGVLQRLDLSIHAAQQYAQFMCFLPVHRATILDLEVHFPELVKKMVALLRCMSTAYEKLKTAPASRGSIVATCRSVIRLLECALEPTRKAVEALKARTPVETLQEFNTWRLDGQRWSQFARLQIAARALLDPTDVQAYQVPQLAAALLDCGRRQVSPLMLENGSASTEHNGQEEAIIEYKPGNAASPAHGSGQLRFLSLKTLADEDTRLYTAGKNLGALGAQICENLPEPVQAAAEDARNAAVRAGGMVEDYLASRRKPDYSEFVNREVVMTEEDDDWMVVDTIDK